ncbi:signal transduction histidine kinase [Clostridium saccharoperbutylacetonicum]|uniref:histidine kinase n=1 Tax=Clostridium saccharoperbutylacetonicum N1-4(HMT) TaxID=931276 RepID=M1MDL4_9CLOT|nr:ATP-binding protein [Clostridium saccharoperbutylacetonicum]AGF56014.1 sensor histidine kinase ResE [Clostridium saccharoperbutylacetonicum N1-4(HMT)]NRT63247.1 signal transduction histidine kinase [Clostridium saccharoperbutylacetonicum]NSB45959.1 signal transduction histidine kinase [Clostridium saccharoperbutylacetonicum]
MHILSIFRKKIIEYLHLVVMCVSLYYVSKFNFVYLDASAEIVTVLFGFILILIILSTIKACDSKYFHLIAFILSIFGIIALFVDDYGENNLLYILFQYYECILLNLSVKYINKKANLSNLFSENKILVSLFLFITFVISYVSKNYDTKYSLDILGSVSAVLIILGYIIFFYRIIKTKANILNGSKLNLFSLIFFKSLSYLCFSLFNDTTINILGHLFENIVYYYIFNIIIKEIVINPYNNLFNRFMNKSQELEIANKKIDKISHKAANIEKLNDKFINLIPDGIIIIRDKKIESVNDRLLNMFDINDELEVEKADFDKILDSSQLDIFMSRINSMDSRILEKPQEYEIKWDGMKKWVEVKSLIANDERGEYIISAIRNIEDRKKVEEAEKLLELKNKEESLKNDFFANISHELRTPINVIYSALQVQNGYLKKDNCNENVLKYNLIIKQNCLRLMRLINNIIDITRIESSFFIPNYKIENIVYLVEEITMSIAVYVKSKNIKLIFDTEVEEAYVNCDSNLIERIMLNVLSNAVKYGKEGGNIFVNIYKDGENNILISVKDDGMGIPSDMQANIFERFSKVDNSISRKIEGSGIGLSLVKQLVEIQQGTIVCESELNVGSEFKITFPTVEYSLEDVTDEEQLNCYSNNAIETAEIEFSDIY